MLVSIITPTYNRRAFLPRVIECVKSQTWPLLEWIILDDGTDKVGDLFDLVDPVDLINPLHHSVQVRYIACPDGEKLPIGAKRNRLNDLAQGDLIVCMDDDDYYPPDRVAHAINSLLTNSDCKIAGSSEMYLKFTDRDEVWRSGPFGPNHATNNTMAYWRSYTKNHRYDETVAFGEERSFTNDWTEPMVQLNPISTVLMTCHDHNTFDKRVLLKNPPSIMQKIDLAPWPAV